MPLFNGKSKPQSVRDVLRNRLQTLGLVDDGFNIALSDGSKFNIGVDGQGGQREWSRPELRRPDQTHRSNLNAWDVDYTRDLDAVVNLAGDGLALMIYGDGENPHVGQIGNYFTNAAVSRSKNPELSKENYAQAMLDMQKMYKDAGIGNKDDAYKLSNQLLHEGRISQLQAVQMQQGINLVFDGDKSYQAATQLLEGVKLGRQGSAQAAAAAPANEGIKGPKLSSADFWSRKGRSEGRINKGHYDPQTGTFYPEGKPKTSASAPAPEAAKPVEAIDPGFTVDAQGDDFNLPVMQ